MRRVAMRRVAEKRVAKRRVAGRRSSCDPSLRDGAAKNGAPIFVADGETTSLAAGKITVPVLVMRSEDDQIVPYLASGPLSAKLFQHGTLITYKDFPHGMPTTQAATINADLLRFLKR